MKVGDLVRLKKTSSVVAGPDYASLTGIVINMKIEWPDVEILWSDGMVEDIDVMHVKVINESR